MTPGVHAHTDTYLHDSALKTLHKSTFYNYENRQLHNLISAYLVVGREHLVSFY